MPHIDPIHRIVPPPQPLPSPIPPGRRRRRGSLLGRSLPSQASDTARERSQGQQGRRKRSARAGEVARGPKRRRRDLVKAEEGAVVQTSPGPLVPEREPRHPDADKTGYDAIKEVLGD